MSVRSKEVHGKSGGRNERGVRKGSVHGSSTMSVLGAEVIAPGQVTIHKAGAVLLTDRRGSMTSPAKVSSERQSRSLASNATVRPTAPRARAYGEDATFAPVRPEGQPGDDYGNNQWLVRVQS